MGEIDTHLTPYDLFIPILVGVNYEHRFNQNWSFFSDIGLGADLGYFGFSFSLETGFAYHKFLFGINIYLLNMDDEGSVSFRLGYRF